MHFGWPPPITRQAGCILTRRRRSFSPLAVGQLINPPVIYLSCKADPPSDSIGIYVAIWWFNQRTMINWSGQWQETDKFRVQCLKGWDSGILTWDLHAKRNKGSHGRRIPKYSMNNLKRGGLIFTLRFGMQILGAHGVSFTASSVYIESIRGGLVTHSVFWLADWLTDDGSPSCLRV